MNLKINNINLEFVRNIKPLPGSSSETCFLTERLYPNAMWDSGNRLRELTGSSSTPGLGNLPMDGRPTEDPALWLLTTSNGYHIAQTLKYLFLSEKVFPEPSYAPYSIRSWSGPILRMLAP